MSPDRAAARKRNSPAGLYNDAPFDPARGEPARIVTTLSFSHLRKAYATTVAVDDLSFDVRAGEIFGLLGPNGAGKTTLIRMLMDIMVPDAGSIALDGAPLQAAARDRIGYLPEERGLYRREKVIDMMIYFGMLKGLEARAARESAALWLARVDLQGVEKRRVDELSKGMQQKVQIAAALMHDPDLIVLDEPFSGLDPVNAVLVKEILRERRSRGSLVILSTHQMPMVEELCDRVAMIDRGRLVLYGDLEEIRLRHGDAAVLVDARDDVRTLPLVARHEPRGRLDRIVLKEGVRPRDFMELLVGRGIAVEHFEVARAPLEEIFVRLVRAGRDAA